MSASGGIREGWRGRCARAALLLVALTSIAASATGARLSAPPLSQAVALDEAEAAERPALVDDAGHEVPPAVPSLAEEEDEHDVTAPVRSASLALPTLTSREGSLRVLESNDQRRPRREPAVPTGPPREGNATHS